MSEYSIANEYVLSMSYQGSPIQVTPEHKHSDAPVKYHCARCGVLTHARGNADYMGGPFVSVFVNTLDDASSDELVSGPIRFCDGLHNNWMNPPPDTRHL